MYGTYNLLNEKIDLHGRMRVDTKISKTTTGMKSFLLKAIDPIFKKKKKGEVVPIHITGTYEHPQFGLDLSQPIRSGSTRASSCVFCANISSPCHILSVSRNPCYGKPNPCPGSKTVLAYLSGFWFRFNSASVAAEVVQGVSTTFRFRTPAPASQPAFSHVVLVVEENHSYSEVIGNSSMPYFNSLASTIWTRYAVFCQCASFDSKLPDAHHRPHGNSRRQLLRHDQR